MNTKTSETGSSGALDGSSIFTREYLVKTNEGEISFAHLDDLLEFIQGEMLTAFDNKEMVIALRRTERDGKNI